MLDLRSLEVFYWVSNLGSFRGAAAKLNTTQPAISQRILQLESQTGDRLLDRSTRSVVTTMKGRSLLEYAERILRLHAEMTEKLVEKHQFSGVLRLGVSETIVQTWLQPFIERLDVLYPQLQLEIDVDNSKNLRDRLVAHELDLAFLLGPISAPSVNNLPLSAFPLAFLASPSLQLSAEPVSLATLAAFPIITFARQTRPYMDLSAALKEQDLSHVRIHASASLAPVVRMAIRGMGIALMPRAIVADEIAAGRLVEIRTSTDLPGLNFTASWAASPNTVLVETIAKLALQVATESGHQPLAH
ncbi:MAG: LysR family transcriptional regulator [Rhabdaerophilum sp.]